MKYTENYHLPNWAKTDRIQMEAFNDMTAKLDAALNEHKLAITTKAEQRDLTALNTKVGKCGNCQIYYATYIGTGEYGQANPKSYTFPAPPILFAVLEPDRGYAFFAIRGTGSAPLNESDAKVGITWNGATVSWHSANQTANMNVEGRAYAIMALLAADE